MMKMDTAVVKKNPNYPQSTAPSEKGISLPKPSKVVSEILNYSPFSLYSFLI